MKFITLFYIFLFSFFSYGQENCNNGIDDDGDGKIDINDPDCLCSTTSVPSIIANPSFEVHSACPTNFSIPGDDQLSLATPWIQATEATSDYFNSCGYVLPAIISTGLDTFPDGSAVAGALFSEDWNEYLGAPLLSPMIAGTNYQLTFNIAAVAVTGQGAVAQPSITEFEPVDITLYGCSNAANLPLSTVYSPNIADPTWFEIGHATYTPISSWGETTITFSPTFNVNAIMIGAPNILPSTYLTNNSIPYFIFDNLLLNLASAFGVNISQTGFFCDNNLVLTANITTTISPTATYQWYFNGIAIAGAINNTYSVPEFATNIGQYSVKVTDGSNCYISSRVTIDNTITSPPYTTVQPTCIVTTGSITVTAPAAQYSFDNGVTWQTSPTKNSLAVGTYYIKIKTPSGCISSATGVTIFEPQFLSYSNISVVQPTTCDGKGTITVTSTIAAEYSFDNGVTWTTNATASNLNPGNYLVIIKDAIGCQSAAQLVSIYAVFMVEPNYSSVNPTCSIGGSITITTVADEYSFDDGATWTTNPTATNLPGGYYLIKIRNANGCVSYSRYVYLSPFYLNVTPTYTTIQPTCGTGGSITITSVGAEYSFDNGVTWSTNNTATNLSPGYYIIQIRNNPGCNSYSQYVYIDNFYLPDPNYIVVQPSCGIGGSITITTPSDFYSFDNGVTWTTNPAATNLTSGTYYVLIKNSLNCVSNLIYVNLNYFNLPNPLYVTTNPSCGNNGSITITTIANEYSFDAGTTWTTNPTASNLSSGYYFIMVRNSIDCQSNYITIILNDFENIYPEYTYTNAGCDTYASITITTVADFYSFDGGITWSTNPVVTNLTGNQSYDLVIRSGLNCISPTSTLFISSSYSIIPLANDYQTTVCDSSNNGSENVDLTTYESNLIVNSNAYFFSYFTTFSGAENNNANQIFAVTSCNLSNANNTVYVRVTSSEGCHKVVKLEFTFIDSPVIVMNDSYPLCEFRLTQLDAGYGFDSYLWSTGETSQMIFITQAANYWVTVTENHGSLICDSTKSFNVFLSNPATITSIETSDWTHYQNEITVYVTGIGDYEYSIDGVNYQSSNHFPDLPSGAHTVHVRDRNDCGIVKENVFLLMYPNFFTPNGDGYHDFWLIKLSEFEANFKVDIYDRTSKLMKTLTNNGIGWDGTYNGAMVPADDYWFVVTREDGTQHRGHFALKR